ncbi:mannose-6-phosphate isomerase, putative [Entamoeba invadens IP1]|uniref:mannose-6-phosphate isomerase n=1 Tax=Entamoeba invadens IP1 TaxID=370355 RepID=A0A0A1U7W5_ENTIV|nr:mannose-6-phosphate isomerase, putative [Entamoeba invadens IP1]ELP90885.1 mannose-6-phosphate isomerase, putative [Entamoeba invadens IP1]|eukprot:XP_004257656.1 mannose-6-phosphate isomerase, putative [Entamoeba invadens IP1]
MNGNSLLERIQGRVQHYDWGKEEPCVVSSLHPTEVSPFAEIWYGSHPRLPSLIYNTHNPIPANLPFLLKFLSIQDPLSLQIHPDTETAKMLFERDKTHYADPNAKPEICIPLTHFQCFLGFVDNNILKQQMTENPPLKKVLMFHENDEARDLLVRAHMLSKDQISIFINEMKIHIKNLERQKVILSNHQKLFERLVTKFGEDVGIIASFLLRYEIFEPYHAFFIPPNYPHGYISGECVEAMTSSDNVIRFGLTKKFCDLEALKFIPHETCNKISEVEKEVVNVRSESQQAAQSIRYINPTKYLSSFVATIYHINQGFTVDVTLLKVGLLVLFKGKATIDGGDYDIGASFYVKGRTTVKITAIENASVVLLS